MKMQSRRSCGKYAHTFTQVFLLMIIGLVSRLGRYERGLRNGETVWSLLNCAQPIFQANYNALMKFELPSNYTLTTHTTWYDIPGVVRTGWLTFCL